MFRCSRWTRVVTGAALGLVVAPALMLWSRLSAAPPEKSAAASQAAIDREPAAKESPFVVYGRITDVEGDPLEGVEVRASCGLGTLCHTGATVTDANGQYRLPFRGALTISDTPLGVGTQVATIASDREGWYEIRLCQHGNLMMSDDPDAKPATGYAGMVLPNQPYELNFTMARAASIEGRLVNEFGGAVPGQKIELDGESLPPSSSCLASATTDDKGYFRFDSVLVWKAEPSQKLKWHFSMRLYGVRHELTSDEFEVATADPDAANGLHELTLLSHSANDSVRLSLRRQVIPK